MHVFVCASNAVSHFYKSKSMQMHERCVLSRLLVTSLTDSIFIASICEDGECVFKVHADFQKTVASGSNKILA